MIQRRQADRKMKNPTVASYYSAVNFDINRELFWYKIAMPVLAALNF